MWKRLSTVVLGPEPAQPAGSVTPVWQILRDLGELRCAQRPAGPAAASQH